MCLRSRTPIRPMLSEIDFMFEMLRTLPDVQIAPCGMPELATRDVTQIKAWYMTGVDLDFRGISLKDPDEDE